jgi:hypothetical protein
MAKDASIEALRKKEGRGKVMTVLIISGAFALLLQVIQYT